MPGNLIQGNALCIPLKDKSVQLCCFSPPYWNLRKYSVMPIIFGDPNCSHVWGKTIKQACGRGDSLEKTPGFNGYEGIPRKFVPRGRFCKKCGAWQGQMGLEPNINRYLDNLMLAMIEVWRVLRDDGVCFVNIGDSYWNASGSCRSPGGRKSRIGAGQKNAEIHPLHRGNKSDNPGLRPKTLCLIPQKFAIRCQEAGWIVRSEVIFHKLNPIPESCSDRPTKSHEQVWLLTKTGRYFWDKEAVKERTRRVVKVGWKESDLRKYSCDPRLEKQGTYKGWRKYCPTDIVEKRNIRSVWTMATEPHPEAHFACVDEKTECLTLLGWKKYNKIKEGELIAVFDMQTEKAFWYPVQQILSYNRFKQDQNVVKVKTRNTDMVLTPHHNTIIKRRLGRLPGPLRLGQYSFVKAKDLKPSHYIPRAADWVGTFESPISQDFAELLGWYVTDGHENKNSTRVEIYQSKSANEEKVNRIKYLLDKCGAEYKEATYERTMSGFQKHKLTAFRIHGYIAYKLRELAPHKILSWATLNWTDSLLKRLLDGLIGGDGTRRGNRFQFIQKHKLLPDLVQAITFRLGYQSTLSVQKNEMRQLYVNTERKAKSLRGKNSGIKKIQMVEYEGVVWCPSTDVGTFVARRNGRIFITGNTFPSKLVDAMIRAGSSPRACEICGAPWVRILKKEAVQSPECGGDQYAGKYYEEDRRSAGRRVLKNIAELRAQGKDHDNPFPRIRTVGWRKTCRCDCASTGRCVVFDPFVGIGTTVIMAEKHGRAGVGVDLSLEYLIDIALKKIRVPVQKMLELRF